MVNKKIQITITLELIAKRTVIYIRPTMPQEKKTERERRKYLEPKKYEVFKKLPVSENTVLKKRCQSNYSLALQRQPQKQHQPRLQHFQQNKF